MGQELSAASFNEYGLPDHKVVDCNYEGDDVESTTCSSNSESEAYFTPVSGASFGTANNTVIIFDWDDTLLCSTAINGQTWTLKQLRDLELAAESALHTAMSLGETLVVTNGNATWVQDSAKRFLPRLLPTLSKLTVVSARALYESIFPGDPFMWKKAAFRHLLTQERHVPQGQGLNLIALGDQTPEIEAAQHVVKFIGGSSLVKTVKFKEAPTAPEIMGQLAKVEQDLHKIVREEKSSMRNMQKKSVPSNLDHMGAQAVGWGISTKDEDSSSWKLKLPASTSIKDLWPLLS
mmetsp:Transcript_53107/g.134149  ORF Transcript_53107/g.134149 Transcript_53107/m.134149 type:complete len:292 (-) Transcript_53107:36-911(-)